MRMRLMLGAVLAALTVGGCGGSDDPSRSAAGEEGARGALLAFSGAMIDAKYDDACAVLTERAKQQFVNASSPCPEALKAARGLIKEKVLKGLKDKARKVKIAVKGDKATADSVSSDASSKTNLVRQGGRWFVDADSP